jgi:LPXTG-motif cell wall-anchored protein
MSTFRVVPAVCAGLLAAMLPLPQAKADAWDQKTIFTFSAPVEIPGQVLTPGTYVFKLADSQSDRNIVQVFNKNENHLYGTFLAIPDYRLRPTGKPVITFEERAAGAPPAVKAWFYPGDNYGHEFLYHKVRAVETAQATNTAPPPVENQSAQNTAPPPTSAPEVSAPNNEPLTAQNSTQGEAAREATQPPPPQTESQAPPQTLPQTASSYPLLGLLGLLSLASGGLLWRSSARHSTNG